MKKLIIAASAILSISIASCGNQNPKISPESTSVSGDLSPYIQVVDNKYELIDHYGGKLSIKVKALKPVPQTELDGHIAQITASLLGADGTPVSGTGTFETAYSSRDKLAGLLKRGSGEEVIELESMLTGYKSDDADRVKKFSLTSSLKADAAAKEEVSSTSSTTASSETAAESGSSDIDAALDEYEKLTDDYINMVASMDKDDAGGTMSSYANALVRTQEVGARLEASKSQLKPKQAARMVKIQSKLAKAMAKSNSVH